MKRVDEISETAFGMANLNPLKSGLRVHILSNNQGVTRNKCNGCPSVIIIEGKAAISVSIEKEPCVLNPKNWKKRFNNSIVTDFERAIQYVGRNFDLFQKHYNDIDGSFDDESLFSELRCRGEYQ